MFEFNEKSLALRVYDVGIHILLQNLVTKKHMGQDSNQTSSINISGTTEEKLGPDMRTQSQVNLPKQVIKKSTRAGSARQEFLDLSNEELNSLEVAMNRANKQSKSL